MELNSTISHRLERHETLYQDVRICSVVSIQGGDSHGGAETHKLQWSETAALIPSWINMPMQFTMDECLVQGSYLVLVFDLVCLCDVEKIFQGSNRLAYVLWG